MENSFHFSPFWKMGMKGDLTAFQKAKLLRFYYEWDCFPRQRRARNDTAGLSFALESRSVLFADPRH
jgi:hypothetical protein